MTHQHPTDRISCGEVPELLPWWLNGTLEVEEEREVREHLAACKSCRTELEETVEVWQMFDWHVPSLELARHACGVDPGGPARERLKRHLAICPSCHEELEIAMADRVVAFPDASTRAARVDNGGRRRASSQLLALAASLVALLGAAVLWNVAGPGGDRPDAPSGAPPSPAAAMTASASEAPATGIFQNGFEQSLANTWTQVVGLAVKPRLDADIQSRASTEARRDPRT